MPAEWAGVDDVADLFSFYRKTLGHRIARRGDHDRIAAAAKVKDDVRRRSDQVIRVAVHIDLAFAVYRHVNAFVVFIERPAVKFFPFSFVHNFCFFIEHMLH